MADLVCVEIKLEQNRDVDYSWVNETGCFNEFIDN